LVIPDANMAELTRRLSTIPPDALAGLVTKWSDNNHPIFVMRRTCFEALVSAQQTKIIDGAIIACGPAAASGHLTTTQFITSILNSIDH
jgi:hypothetical protein